MACIALRPRLHYVFAFALHSRSLVGHGPMSTYIDRSSSKRIFLPSQTIQSALYSCLQPLSLAYHGAAHQLDFLWHRRFAPVKPSFIFIRHSVVFDMSPPSATPQCNVPSSMRRMAEFPLFFVVERGFTPAIVIISEKADRSSQFLR